MVKKRKVFIIGGSIFTIVAILIMVISYLAAYKTLHKEKQKILKTPKDYKLSYENIEFKSPENYNLKGWWIEGNTDKVIIVAHGYSANRAGWHGVDKAGNDEYLDWLCVAPFLVDAGYSMLYFDFRASGESEGDLITLGKLEANDLMAAVNWQLKYKNKKKIGLLGFSMGGNVVLRAGVELNEMVKNHEIENAAIIAIGPYKYNTMLKKSIKYWTSLPSFFTPFINQSAKIILGFDPSEEINPEKYINNIAPLPVFFLQSEKDEIGDVDDVKSMYNKYSGDKELIIIPDAKRFVHYNYPKDNPEKIIGFYNKYLAESNIQ